MGGPERPHGRRPHGSHPQFCEGLLTAVAANPNPKGYGALVETGALAKALEL
jgi:hypothetical protein